MLWLPEFLQHSAGIQANCQMYPLWSYKVTNIMLRKYPKLTKIKALKNVKGKYHIHFYYSLDK